MKTLIILGCVFLSACSVKEGQYVGGKDRCYVYSYGCNMYVKNGVLVNGVGVNLVISGHEIGGGKRPQVTNEM